MASFWDETGLGKALKASPEGSEPQGGGQPGFSGGDGGDSTLTADEALALKKIVESLSGDGYAQALYDEMAIAVEAGYISGGDLIAESASITANFGVVPVETLDAIRDQADKFAFLVNSREQAQIYALIDTAIATGQTSKALAGAIQASFADGYHVMDDDGELVRVLPTSTWAKMVARTELNRAQTIGQMAVYRNAGIEKVMWQTNHGPTVCDYCDEADGQVVAMGDPFEGVECDAPPAHPYCCCALLPADDDVAAPGLSEAA